MAAPRVLRTQQHARSSTGEYPGKAAHRNGMTTTASHILRSTTIHTVFHSNSMLHPDFSDKNSPFASMQLIWRSKSFMDLKSSFEGTKSHWLEFDYRSTPYNRCRISCVSRHFHNNQFHLHNNQFHFHNNQFHFNNKVIIQLHILH